jgi:DNA polymerase-1
MAERLFLLDGHALAYRSYFALTSGVNAARWQTSKGEPTAGLYGFASILIRILKKDKPDHIAIAFDTGRTFRNDLFEDYKATRAKMPDDLRPQVERMRELTDRFGFPRLEMEGYEADDVLGSVSKLAADQGYDVTIITGDRDLFQLVQPGIKISLSGGKLADSKLFDVAAVKEALGVLPDQVIDYKALVGDPSDNYGGVAGVGPKTAVTLLDSYQTLDGIYDHLEEIKGTLREKLEKDRSNAYLSRDLATIRTDLQLPDFNVEKCATNKINFAEVEAFFNEMEFKSLIPEIRQLRAVISPQSTGQISLFQTETADDPANMDGESAPTETIIIDNEDALNRMLASLSSAEMLALDTETTSTDPMNCHLVGVSLSSDTGKGYYLPVGHLTGEKQLPLETVQKALKPLFANTKSVKAGHNIKYDMIVLANNGMPVTGKLYDTMIAAWVADPASTRLGLKAMANDRLGVSMQTIDTLIGKGKNQLTMAQVTVKDAAPYAAADADMTLRLVPVTQQVLQNEGTTKILDELELPLIPILAEMEMNGIRVDRDFLAEMSKTLQERLNETENAVYEQIGYTFNLNSPQQLSKALFEDLGLDVPGVKRKTASGHYSTAADVLEEMQDAHPVIDLVLEYRELSKLKSTYVDALPLSINPKTGKVHTSFNQTGAVTGRLASNDPNLQNIPIRTELGQKVRNAFVADPGNVLLSVDYSQIELRIVADMAQDEGMLKAFRAGQDIHSATAAAIYGIPIENVTKEMRRHAKAINFGLIYGMSPFGLSRSANLSRKDAEAFVAAYFRQFPGIKKFLDGIKLQAAEQGYVSTMMGRKRYFPTLGSQRNYNLRAREEREAINAPVQGTAADIMKKAMIDVYAMLKKTMPEVKMLLQVHDELLLECPLEQLEKARASVQKVMENAVKLSIPLLTEAKSGENWGEMTPFA